MPNPMKIRLLTQLASIYLLAAVIGTFLLTINNIYLNHSTLVELLVFNIPAVLTGDLIILLLLMILSGMLLSRIRNEEELQVRLLKLPSHMFIGLIMVSIVFSCLYHYSQFVFYGAKLSELTERDWLVLSKNFIAELTIALVIGTLQYALSRRAVRPYIIRLKPVELAGKQKTTFVFPMTIASASCIFITGSAGYEYLIWNETGAVDLEALLLIVSVRFVFALFVFYLLIMEMRGDLRTIHESISALLKGGTSALHKPVPVVSGDELGQLTEAFNILQKKVAKDYEEVRQELLLSYNVQQKLLPPTFLKGDGYEIAASSIPSKEIGGDLFDILELRNGGFAAMVGDVSGKGIPAAMLMSAVLMLFRSELRNGGTPGEVLTRLNATLAGTLQGNLYVTMSLGIWNADTRTWHYASAGHVSPYLLKCQDELTMLPCSSLPLGIDAEEVYSDKSIELRAGDTLLLYSDGVVESGTEEGALFGFDSFEMAIGKVRSESDVREQLRQLMDQLPKPHNGRYDDDRTLVFIRLLEEVNSCNEFGNSSNSRTA